ncbi:hypothetical protein Spla01_06531 [Streptomyces platensis]|uniref:Uncharacterized protein n=1 Tax=Streptomyces platensis TaxID=58346 RepID=A0ABX3XLR0_STRPT|nr:hypothetical protein [Streptomyces platensis]OSY34907.1 hypothetical protein BG653_07332 [Streptomyces platensis]
MSIRKVLPVKPACKHEEKRNRHRHPKPAHKKHQRRRPIGF